MTLPAAAAGRLRQAGHDLIIWAIYARERRLETAQADVLYHFAAERVRIYRDVLAEAGVERNDPYAMQWFRDAEQLLVAFFDSSMRGQLEEAWRPLQRELYGHERLGQEVFERIETLAQTPIAAEAPVEALEVFERCLLLGYHGAAVDRRIDRDRLQRFAGKLNAVLHRAPPPLAPALAGLSLKRRWTPLLSPVWVVGTALALLVLWVGGVRWRLHSSSSDVQREVREGLASHSACSAGPSR